MISCFLEDLDLFRPIALTSVFPYVGMFACKLYSLEFLSILYLRSLLEGKKLYGRMMVNFNVIQRQKFGVQEWLKISDLKKDPKNKLK